MEDIKDNTTSSQKSEGDVREGSVKGLVEGKKLKAILKDALFSDDSPKKIALGMGIGVLMAFSPLAGTQTVSALFLAFLFRANRLSTLAGTLVANPLTMPVFYFAEILIGKEILGLSLTLPKGGWGDIDGIFKFGRDILFSSFLGFTILGPISSIAFYLVTYRAATFLKERRTGAEIS